MNVRIPEVWDARWFAGFVRTVLRLNDDNTASSSAELTAHDALATAHSAAFAAHKAEVDPHPTYMTSTEVDSSISAHAGASDPHPVYMTSAEVDSVIDVHEGATDPHPDLIDELTAATAVALADQVIVSQSGTNKRATVEQLRDVVFGDDWTDLVIPAVGINPAGAAAPPTLNNTTGCLEFSASADNVIIITWQMPHGWAGQYSATAAMATVVPHLHVRHLTSTTAPNNVSRWKCEYDVADPFGNFTNAYGTFTAMPTVSVTNPANTALCFLVDLGDLDLSGYGGSCILHCKISRLAASDAADLDTSVIALYSADLHYRVRSAGSENEIPS